MAGAVHRERVVCICLVELVLKARAVSGVAERRPWARRASQLPLRIAPYYSGQHCKRRTLVSAQTYLGPSNDSFVADQMQRQLLNATGECPVTMLAP